MNFIFYFKNINPQMIYNMAVILVLTFLYLKNKKF